MEELDNFSIKSLSTISSSDNEATDNEKNYNKPTNDKPANDESNDEKATDEKPTDEKQTDDKPINDKPTDEESNDNQQSKTNLIDKLLFEDKWMLKLDWTFRVELIKLLDKYIKLLVSNKEISTDEENLIEKDKTDLINVLTQSPLKLDKESNSYEIFIYLDNIFKHQIIDQLIKNENLIIYCKDKLDKNLKDQLINCNNHLITKLINLPVEFKNNDANAIDEELKSNQLESKDEKLVNKFESEISNLKEELDKVKSELDDSKCVTLYYLKKDIKKFFENDTKIYTKPIEFLNIKWFIGIHSKYYDEDKKKYLKFYLHAKNEIDDGNNVKWECETSYELILKSNKEDKIEKIDYTFENTEGYGFPKFISEDELFNNENGYIEDDSIKLEVKLTVQEIERNI